jgi:hypothetical protein
MAEHVQTLSNSVLQSFRELPPNSSELRCPEFPRIPSATRPEYLTLDVRSSSKHTLENTVNNPTIECENPNDVSLAEMYINSLSPKEKKAYLIARDHLGMSFTLKKSVGFLQWRNTAIYK